MIQAAIAPCRSTCGNTISRTFPRIRNALRDQRLSESDAVEEAQGAHNLIEPRPRNARRDQVNLEGANIFKFQFVRRLAEIPAEL
jgi:hypothetical protein